jgi:hypothetical protein
MASIRSTSASWLPPDFLEWHCLGGRSSSLARDGCLQTDVVVAIVVGNWLYVDGGEIWASSLSGSMEESLNHPALKIFPQFANLTVSFTVTIDLNSSWTTSDVVATAYPHPDSIGDAMLTRTPAMWFDTVKNSVYRFSGYPYSNPPVAVFAFRVNDHGSVNWTEEYTGGIDQPSSMSTFSGFTNPGVPISVYTPTAFYALGGTMGGSTDPGVKGLGAVLPLTGLVEYNFDEVQWSNASSTAYGGTIFGGNTGFAVAGQGLYIPIFGLQGILVFIGGDAPTTQTVYEEDASLVLMDQVSIYDIHSQTFYVQTAGGVVPNPRTNFCAVGAGSANNSTWEMYVVLAYW